MKKIFARDGMTLSVGTVSQRQLAQAGTLVALRGLLWITVQGQAEDHWLSAGRSLALTAGDRIVVEAFDVDAMFMLMPLAKLAELAPSDDITKWNLCLPEVTQSSGIFIQGKRASNVTGKFFRQWCARQPRFGAT